MNSPGARANAQQSSIQQFGTRLVMRLSRERRSRITGPKKKLLGGTMEPIVVTYAAYIVISIFLTVWVARTLHKNGRFFLIEVFSGDESLADSVNHLLVVRVLPNQLRICDARVKKSATR